MKSKNSSLIADISFMILLVLLFVCMIFVASHPENFFMNSIFLVVVFFLIILTYFTNLTTGLIVNVVLIFGYTTFLLYSVVAYNRNVSQSPYFWIVISPLITISTAMVFKYSKEIEKENERMNKIMGDLVTIDESTGLKNRQSFLSDMKTYQSISRRYHLHLLVVVCQYRYPNELKGILGDEQMRTLTSTLSEKISSNSFRIEDVTYLISKNPMQWGILMLENQPEDQLILSRLRSKVNEMDMTEIFGKNVPQIDIRLGAAYDSEDIKTPLELLDKAIDQMQYDV